MIIDNQHVDVQNGITMLSSNGTPVNAIPWKAESVTPSATNIFPMGILYVGVGGDVVAMPGGQTSWVTFKNVPDGSFLPFYIQAVNTLANGTTATNILVCY